MVISVRKCDKGQKGEEEGKLISYQEGEGDFEFFPKLHWGKV